MLEQAKADDGFLLTDNHYQRIDLGFFADSYNDRKIHIVADATGEPTAKKFVRASEGSRSQLCVKEPAFPTATADSTGTLSGGRHSPRHLFFRSCNDTRDRIQTACGGGAKGAVHYAE
jgi:hypothetical protein